MNNLGVFKKQLLALQRELEGLKAGLKESAATVVLDQNSVGRLSRMDAMQAQQMALEAERRRKMSLLQISAALLRIKNNEYGFCEVCDEEIVLGRLRINPTVTRCMGCSE